MSRSRTFRPRRAPAMALAVAAGFCLAACGGGASSPGSRNPRGTTSDLFPAIAGSTWVYEEMLGSAAGLTTNKIISVTPAGEGKRVTITTRTDVTGLPSAPSTLVYVLRPDGSVVVPVARLGDGTITVRSGSVVWPPKAVLDSGRPSTSTLVLSVSTADRTLTVRAHVTVQGGGTQKVTVPAGTYTATVVDETISEKIEGVSVTVTIRTWLAAGVGPVKSVTSTRTSSPSEQVSIEVLTSFTRS